VVFNIELTICQEKHSLTKVEVENYVMI